MGVVFFGFVCLSVFFLEGTVSCILFWEALQVINCF